MTTSQGHNQHSDSRPREPEPHRFTAANIPAESGPQRRLGSFEEISDEQHLETIAWIRSNRARLLAEGSGYQYGATTPGGGPQEQGLKFPPLEIPAFRIITSNDQSLGANPGPGSSGPPVIRSANGGVLINEKRKLRTRTRSAPTRKREIPACPANEPLAVDTSRKNNKRKISVTTESLPDEESIRDMSTSKRLKRTPKKSA